MAKKNLEENGIIGIDDNETVEMQQPENIIRVDVEEGIIEGEPEDVVEKEEPILKKEDIEEELAEEQAKLNEEEENGVAVSGVKKVNQKKEYKPVVVKKKIEDTIQENSVENDDLTNPEHKRLENWNSVVRYKHRGDIIESRVVAVEPDEEKKTIHIISSVRGFRVVIPDVAYFTENSFFKSYNKATKDEQFERRLQMARMELNARISFIIKGAKKSTYIDDDGLGKVEYTVVASRLEAMEKKKQIYFFADNIPSSRRIEIGSIVEPRVLSVGEYWVKVEAFGVESRISQFDLSGRKFVSDCRDEVQSGDVIRAVVKKLYVDKQNKKVVLIVSPRILDNDEIGENAHYMKEGTIALGTVRAFNPKNSIYTISLDCNVMAAVHRDRVLGKEPLSKGDKVSVKVTKVCESFVFGNCIKLNNR